MPKNAPFRFPEEPKTPLIIPTRSEGEVQLSEQATRIVRAAREQNGDLPLEPADLPTGEREPFTNAREG